jgi:putative sigma-54 modulation protein
VAVRGAKARPRTARNIDPARVRVVPARIHAKPLSLDEATLELLENGAEFLAFTNAETEQLNVLYRRKDGALGWIAPAGRRRARP